MNQIIINILEKIIENQDYVRQILPEVREGISQHLMKVLGWGNGLRISMMMSKGLVKVTSEDTPGDSIMCLEKCQFTSTHGHLTVRCGQYCHGYYQRGGSGHLCEQHASSGDERGTTTIDVTDNNEFDHNHINDKPHTEINHINDKPHTETNHIHNKHYDNDNNSSNDDSIIRWIKTLQHIPNQRKTASQLAGWYTYNHKQQPSVVNIRSFNGNKKALRNQARIFDIDKLIKHRNGGRKQFMSGCRECLMGGMRSRRHFRRPDVEPRCSNMS